MKLAVIGLGKAGLPLASVIAADSSFEVIGVDLDQNKCRLINQGINPIPEESELDDLIKEHGGKRLFATSDYENARDSRIFIVIVPLFIDKLFNPDFCILESAFSSLGQILKPGDVVILETTVPPGTTENLVRKWLEKASGLTMEQFYLAYSPERIMTGVSVSRLREFPKILGGVNEVSGQKALDVYRQFVPHIMQVSSSRVAEFIKIIEGCYRDLNVALANELFKISEEMEIDFFEARKYANHQYCHIHLPSTGVGGHCIPVYPWFLIKEMEVRERFENVRLLRLARELNDGMIYFWAERIIQEALKVDKPLKDVKILLQGISYREGVKGLYHSRNKALAEILQEKGLEVQICDEIFSPDELCHIGLKAFGSDKVDIIFNCFDLNFKERVDYVL